MTDIKPSQQKNNKMSTTIVTMFFNLKDLQDSSKETRPLEFYLKNGKGTLKINNPMIIFCDAVTKPYIKNIREELSDAPTIYIERDINSYDYYKLNWSIINENRKKAGTYKNSRNTPSYFLLTLFKIVAIKIALDRNDFSSTHYTWVDFGCSHVMGDSLTDDVMNIIKNPKPKITVVYIHYRSHKELGDMVKICNDGTCGIAAGIFSAEATFINKFYSCAWSIFYEKLSKGIGHTEETIMTYCYDRYPELFTLNFGDYNSLASNYHHVVKDYYPIKYYFISNAINAGKHELAKIAAQNIKDSLKLGLITLPVEEREYIDTIINS